MIGTADRRRASSDSGINASLTSRIKIAQPFPLRAQATTGWTISGGKRSSSPLDQTRTSRPSSSPVARTIQSHAGELSLTTKRGPCPSFVSIVRKLLPDAESPPLNGPDRTVDTGS